MGDFCREIWGFCLNVVERVLWLPPLFARVAVGWVFLESGWLKLQDLGSVIEFFQSIGIPSPELHAPFVSGVELVCGALLILGLITRFSSVLLIVTMGVAIVTAKREDIASLSDLFSLSEFLFIVILFWLLVAGAGALSADAVIAKLFGPTRKRNGRY